MPPIKDIRFDENRVTQSDIDPEYKKLVEKQRKKKRPTGKKVYPRVPETPNPTYAGFMKNKNKSAFDK